MSGTVKALQRELDALKHEKQEATLKVTAMISKLSSEKKEATEENLELSSRVLELETKLDDMRRSAQLPSSHIALQGRYDALLEENDGLKCLASTLRTQLSSQRRERVLASPPTTTTSSGPADDVEAARLRSEISDLSRENRRLAARIAESSDYGVDRKRKKRSSPTTTDDPQQAVTELEEMHKLWESWRSDIITAMGDNVPDAPPSSSHFPPMVASIVSALDKQRKQALQQQLKVGELSSANQSLQVKFEVRACAANDVT